MPDEVILVCFPKSLFTAKESYLFVFASCVTRMMKHPQVSTTFRLVKAVRGHPVEKRFSIWKASSSEKNAKDNRKIIS